MGWGCLVAAEVMVVLEQLLLVVAGTRGRTNDTDTADTAVREELCVKSRARANRFPSRFSREPRVPLQTTGCCGMLTGRSQRPWVRAQPEPFLTRPVVFFGLFCFVTMAKKKKPREVL